MRNIIIALFALLLMTACGTHKAAQDSTSVSSLAKDPRQEELKYITKVLTNNVTTENIVAKLELSIEALGQTVDGKIQMRKNEMIRVTLSPFGLMEVGRLEFTPENVLLVDRINKQYVKAKYSDLDFLKNNGLDFYALQSLFWNQLFQPGETSVTDSNMQKFSVDMSQANRKISLSSGELDFEWETNPSSHTITATNIDYGKNNGTASRASWTYDDFTDFNGKSFPMKHTLSFTSKAFGSRKINTTFKFSKPTDDSKWDTNTNISSKYQQVTASEILRKLTNL